MVSDEELRAVLRRFPTGVAVAAVDADGQRLGLTVASLVPLSLDPPLVGFAVRREAALHELLREARRVGISMLAADQEPLADRFARGLPPIAHWVGVELLEREGPPLLAGAVAWLVCDVQAEVAAGSHTFFLTAPAEALAGDAGRPLVRVDGSYRAG